MSGLYNASFVRGDSNEDGAVNIADPVRTLVILFKGYPMPECADAVDANDDGRLDISDPVTELNFLFRAGEALPAPGSAFSGFDRTGDSLYGRGGE